MDLHRFADVDVTDLAAVAALPDVAELGDDVGGSGRLGRWLVQARTFARAGVIPSPSHVSYGDGRQVLSVWGAFFDAQVLVSWLASRFPDRWSPEEPLVLFACPVDPSDLVVPPLPWRADWFAVATQSCGLLCHHRYFVGVPLPLHRAGLERALHVARFADRSGHDCVGLGGLALEELVDYHQWLCDVGLTCSRGWDVLEEAVYPLDVSCVADFSDLLLPSFDELVDTYRSSGGGRGEPVDGRQGDGVDGCVPSQRRRLSDTLERLSVSRQVASHWKLLVLGDNCD